MILMLVMLLLVLGHGFDVCDAIFGSSLKEIKEFKITNIIWKTSIKGTFFWVK